MLVHINTFKHKTSTLLFTSRKRIYRFSSISCNLSISTGTDIYFACVMQFIGGMVIICSSRVSFHLSIALEVKDVCVFCNEKTNEIAKQNGCFPIETYTGHSNTHTHMHTVSILLMTSSIFRISL